MRNHDTSIIHCELLNSGSHICRILACSHNHCCHWHTNILFNNVHIQSPWKMWSIPKTLARKSKSVFLLYCCTACHCQQCLWWLSLATKNVGFYIKCPIFLFNFNQMRIFFTFYFIKVPNIKFHKNLSSVTWSDPCRQTW